MNIDYLYEKDFCLRISYRIEEQISKYIRFLGRI
jgi:hypothetical protein